MGMKRFCHLWYQEKNSLVFQCKLQDSHVGAAKQSVQLVASTIPACTCVRISILASSAKQKPYVTKSLHVDQTFQWPIAQMKISLCHLGTRWWKYNLYFPPNNKMLT